MPLSGVLLDQKQTTPFGGCLKVTFDHEIDGDTAGFWVDGEIKTVRFFVIDTPEVSPNRIRTV